MGGDHTRKRFTQVKRNNFGQKTQILTKPPRSAVLGHNVRFHRESTCLKAAVPEIDSLGPESMVCAETRYEAGALLAWLPDGYKKLSVLKCDEGPTNCATNLTPFPSGATGL